MPLHRRRAARANVRRLAWSFARLWLLLLGVALLALAVLGLFRLDVGGWDSAGAGHWSHWLTGLALVGAALLIVSDRVLAPLALWAGIVFLFTAVWSLVTGDLGRIGDPSRADDLMHAAVGLVSIAAGWASRPAGEVRGRPGPT